MNDIKVKVTHRSNTIDLALPNGALVEEALRKMGLNVSAQIVLRGSTPIPLDDLLADGDELRVIETFSGG